MLATVTAAQEPFMMPCGVPYECATNIRVANATATWKMTFDRRWPAIYDIVHWDITFSDGRRAEYLAQLVRPPDHRMYYRFFIHERHGIWYTLGIRKKMVWRDVSRRSREDEEMIQRLRQLYRNASALQFGADSRTLRF
jgi:hypothetical protein